MLNEIDINTIESVLFSDENAETALDYYGFHGLVTASVVAPYKIDNDTLWAIAIGADPDQKTDCPSEMAALVQKLQKLIKVALEDEEAIILPFADEDDDETITNWCTGFIEGHLVDEDRWFEKDDETVAELLLPIISMSDFYDELEMQDLHKNASLMVQLIEQIPEVVTDLYLFYHSNEK